MAELIIPRSIEEDMKESYVDYAMSVIIGRAIPDVRDGLKPVHRRILYTMYQLNNTHDKPYKKSARVVGDCLGKFHPHGDMAIYDTLVRMAQDFSLRYPLVDGHGNMGSIDGDAAAAMRYTEVRMAKIADEMLADIEKNTVDFIDNFDGTVKEPVVLPAKIPNLLINGSSGIAVGMATNIPPHNLNEMIDAAIALIDEKSEDEVLSFIKGPDFPTGATVIGKKGIMEYFKTGKGSIKIRAKAEIEERKITITEIPYQITKTAIIESIVEAVKNKKVEGIAGVHDHSDKQGLALVIELKRDATPEVVLNQLYAHTLLETAMGVIMLAIVKNKPKLLTLYEMIKEFVEFRKEIVRKRCLFELEEAENRAHILQGLRIALENIDNVVALLKSAKDTQMAKDQLMTTYSLSEKQALAILDMKISKIVSLEREKIENEYKELQEKIRWLKEVLSDIKKILDIIKKELLEIKEKYGDERKTEIVDVYEEITDESLIPNKDVVVSITNNGYIKRVDINEYRLQGRGGKGIIAAETHENDFVKDIIVTKTHDYLLIFTNKGRMHWLKVYQIPETNRYALGRSIVNLLDLKDEKVTAWISVSSFAENEYLFMITKNGIVKRTSLSNFNKPRKGGIIAITLKEGDQLIDVIKTNGNDHIFIGTKKGQAIKFDENEAREIGRTAQGVIGIRLNEGDYVIGATACRKPAILTICENGYGKRTEVSEYRLQGRGGYGVINIKTEGRNGDVVGIAAVGEKDEVIVIGSKGKSIRVPVSEISLVGRNTQGVRIIRLEEDEKVSSFAVITEETKKSEDGNI
ncbi:MAG: DNA gyrase subunit A [Candidatus Bilamarchaeaceae archaeon]